MWLVANNGEDVTSRAILPVSQTECENDTMSCLPTPVQVKAGSRPSR